MKKLRILRITLAAIIGLLTILCFAGLFYPIHIMDIQLGALIQKNWLELTLASAALLIVLIILTFFMGRIYCSTLCPLGLLQELLMLVFRRPLSPKRSRCWKYLLAAVAFGTLFGGSALIFRQLDPYSIFGSVIGANILGIATLLIIVALVWLWGRVFCANICPIGALLGLISKHALFQVQIDKDKCVSCGACSRKCPTGSIFFKDKTVDNETCIKCFNCLNTCPRKALSYHTHKAKKEIKFSPQRRQLLIGGSALALFVLAAKSGIKFGEKALQSVKAAILPAGAKNLDHFANRCLNCNLCVQNCPHQVIKPADSEHPFVHLDYSENFCSYKCHKCSDICPSGALQKMTLELKRRTQIGIAQINPDQCVRCGLCIMKCPREALTREGHTVPQVLTDKCIGCGLCQNTCPVKAITIKGLSTQIVLEK